MKTKPRIITLGRQFGAGGHSVAAAISEILNIPVYDNELISKAAEESGFSRELFERSDEKKSNFNLLSIFGTDRFGSGQNYVSDNELFKIQSEVIRGIAEKGPAIFVGRCSNYILRERECRGNPDQPDPVMAFQALFDVGIAHTGGDNRFLRCFAFDSVEP